MNPALAPGLQLLLRRAKGTPLGHTCALSLYSTISEFRYSFSIAP